MNKKAKIVLNSMVGNEARTITRMLESVVPYISYWVIQCNGNDETESIINKFFADKGIPGFTYKVEWKFPGWNRDHTLQTCLKAEHGCDWILRMDADEKLHVDEDFDWSILDNTNIQSYNITASAGDTRYFRTWFWNAKLPWFFQHDIRHETIHLPDVGEDFERANMPWGFRHLVINDGNTWLAPRKFLRDALELEIDKVVGNTVLEDSYHLWYVAKSYADCYGKPEELAFGKEHSDEYARRAIWYFEKYLQHAEGWKPGLSPKRINEMSFFALICIAQAFEFMGENSKSLEYYDYAVPFAPNRNEAKLYKVFALEKMNRYQDALNEIEFMLRPERTNPFPASCFLIENRAYGNTSNFLNELKEKYTRAMTEHVVELDSVKFEF